MVHRCICTTYIHSPVSVSLPAPPTPFIYLFLIRYLIFGIFEFCFFFAISRLGEKQDTVVSLEMKKTEKSSIVEIWQRHCSSGSGVVAF